MAVWNPALFKSILVVVVYPCVHVFDVMTDRYQAKNLSR